MLAHWIVWVKVCAFRWLLVTDSSRLTVFASSWFCRARLCVSVCFGSVEDAVCYLIADLATLIKLSLEALLPDCLCMCLQGYVCVYVFVAVCVLWICSLVLLLFSSSCWLCSRRQWLCVSKKRMYACAHRSVLIAFLTHVLAWDLHHRTVLWKWAKH